MKIETFMRYKLSTRLQRALIDLIKVEKDPKIVVFMDKWFNKDTTQELWNPNIEDFENSDVPIDPAKPAAHCCVCHAGSVLAKSINGKQFEKILKLGDYWPEEQFLGKGKIVKDFENFLYGVNSLRLAEFEAAEREFGLPGGFFDKCKAKHYEYEDSPKKYKRYFQNVINYVKRNGY